MMATMSLSHLDAATPNAAADKHGRLLVAAEETQAKRKRVRFEIEDYKEGDSIETFNSLSLQRERKRRRSLSSPPLPLYERLTEETCQRLWYSGNEIATFQAETRYIILSRRSQATVLDNTNDASGLERFTLQRSNRKKLAIRMTLLAQSTFVKQQQQKAKVGSNRNRNSSLKSQDASTVGAREEFINDIAKQCSGWAVKTAIKQGYQDFVQANL